MSKARNKKTPRRKASGLDLIMTMIFDKSFPVWKCYSGAVPPEALEKLELDGDWPHGLATAAIKRLTRDADLRNWIADRLESK